MHELTREALPKTSPDLTTTLGFLEELDEVQQRMIALQKHRTNRNSLDRSKFENSARAPYEITKILTHNFFMLRNRVVGIKAAHRKGTIVNNSTKTDMEIENLVNDLWGLYQQLKDKLYSGDFEVK